MKKPIITFLAILVAAWTLGAEPLKKSEIRTDSVQSKILGEQVDFNVYLPAGYDAEAKGAQYPIVYLLHGLYGGNVDWAEKGHMKNVVDELIASGEVRPMIIVTPDAGDPDARNNWNGYFNMPGHSYEDFFFKEFVPAVEARYKVISDKGHRAIMGLSMGGGGSVVYSQRHPDMFSSCYAMSAWLDNDEPFSDNPKDKLNIVCRSVHEHSAIDFVHNADAATVEALKTVKWFGSLTT